MDETSKLSNIDSCSFCSNQSRKGSNTIEEEETFEVIQPILLKLRLLLISTKPEKVHNNIQSEANIDIHFKLSEVFREFFENKHEWGGEKSIYCECVGEETPQLRKRILLTNNVPLPLILCAIVDVFQNVLSIIIFVQMLVFLVFVICEFDSLEEKDSSGFHPEPLDPILLLHLSHLVPRYVEIILDLHATAEKFAAHGF